jgi:hypothetical protein
MAIFKNKNNNKCWPELDKTGILIHCCCEYKLVQSLWNAVWRFLKKLKIELPYDPVIPLLSIYPIKLLKRICGNYIRLAFQILMKMVGGYTT